MNTVEPRGSSQTPLAPNAGGIAESHYSVPAPSVYRLGALRHRFWNRLAQRPMVYWRNAFWCLRPMGDYEPIARRPRTIWGQITRGDGKHS